MGLERGKEVKRFLAVHLIYDMKFLLSNRNYPVGVKY